MAKYSTEKHYVIYNDGTGEKIVVKPDADSVSLIEITSYTSDGVADKSALCFTTEQAPFVMDAIHNCMLDIANNEKKNDK